MVGPRGVSHRSGMCGVMGSSGVVGIACGYGRNLMLAAFQVAHMSSTPRQSGGTTERVRRTSGDVVPWVGAASWESRVAVDET